MATIGSDAKNQDHRKPIGLYSQQSNDRPDTSDQTNIMDIFKTRLHECLSAVGSTASRATLAAKVCDILSEWKNAFYESRIDGRPTKLCYILDISYLDGSLRRAELDKRDQAILRVLQEAYRAHKDHGFYLANMQRELNGGYDDIADPAIVPKITRPGIYDLRLTSIFDMNGNKIAESIQIEEEDIVQPRPYNRNPNHIALSEISGTMDDEMCHSYFDTVVILSPFGKSHLQAHFWLAGGDQKALEERIIDLRTKVMTPNSRPALKKSLAEYLTMILATDEHNHRPGAQSTEDGFSISPVYLLEDLVAETARSAMCLKQPDLFRRATAAISRNLDWIPINAP